MSRFDNQGSIIKVSGQREGRSLEEWITRLSGVSPFPGPEFAIFGTSITDQSSRNVVPPAASPSRSWMVDGYASWLRVLTHQRINLPVENDFGVSGDTLQMMLARISQVIRARPNFCVVEGGSNNVGTDDFATMRSVWTQIVTRLSDEGIAPIILPMPPRAGAVLTAAQVKTQQRFYNFQREFCYRNRGYMFADYIGQFLDQTSAASVPVAGLLKADNLHPATPGAFYMGKALADLINPILPPLMTHLVANADIYDAATNPTGSLHYTGAANRSTLSGTGGTQTANAGLTYAGTGLAAGMTFLRGTATSTCTATLSKENPRTDAGRASGERQIVQLAAATGGGADEIYNLRFSPAIADIQEGDWYYSQAAIEVTAAPVNVSAIELHLLETRPSNSQTAMDMAMNTALAFFLPAVTWSGALRTPPIQRQADATAVQANIRARLNAAAGAASVTFKVGDYVTRKVGTEFAYGGL